jgi:hypothetical protein
VLRGGIRRHHRLRLLLLPVLVWPVIWLMGCDPPPSSSQVNITKAQARQFLKEGDKSVKAFVGRVPVDATKATSSAADGATASTQDLFYLNFKGTANLVAPRGSHGFGTFTKGSFRGGGTVGYVSRSDALTGDGEILFKFSARGAGAACVRFSGKTDVTQQYVTGTFDVVGGSGDAARLHDRGAFRAVQPTAFVTDRYRVALFGAPSFGKKRQVPKGCGKPIKAPRPQKFTAQFDGFAFAPASARNGRLPAGTKLYPQGSVSGAVGCGAEDNLYLVTTYSGPVGAILAGTATYGASGKTASLNQALKSGRNAVFLFAAPANGSYQLKADVIPPRGVTGLATFGQEVTLQRSC